MDTPIDAPMGTSDATRPYHHGDLPAVLLRAAADVIEEFGVSSLSLREVARRADVSHGAPAHHFGDKSGLLTALATEGFELFERALVGARDTAPPAAAARFAATSRAYVLFAASHRAHFEVMFQPDLHRLSDVGLREASSKAHGVLSAGVAEAQNAGYAPDADPEALAVTAWATAHGLATLWLQGGLSQATGNRDLPSLLDAVFGPLA